MNPRKDAKERFRKKIKKDVKYTLDNIVDFVAKADEEILIENFAKNPDVFLKAQDSKNNDILNIAIQNKKYKLLAKILEYLPEPLKDNNKQQELMFLINNDGDFEAIRLLLKYMPAKNTRLARGDTFLHLAIRKNRWDLIPIFKEENIDLDIKNNLTETPLILALSEGFDEAAEKLLKIGANPVLCKNDGISPIHLAIGKKCKKTIDILLADREVIKKLNDFKTNIAGAGVRTNNVVGTTPLMIAAQYGDFKIVQKLVNDFGVNINVTNSQGRSAFNFALLNKDEEERGKIFSLFLDKGIDFYLDRESILCDVLSKEVNVDDRIIQAMIDSGVDVNIRDFFSNTPIFYAIKKESEQIFLKLLEAGADIDTKISKKDYLFDILCKMTDEKKALKFFKLSQKYLSNLDEYNFYDRTPLQEATHMGNKAMVEYLLKQPIDIEKKTNDFKKSTALLCVFDKNNKQDIRFDILKLFKKANADMNAIDSKGNNAMHMAIENNFSIDIIRYLYEKCGVNYNLKNNVGKTPYDLAIEKQEINTALYLTEKLYGNINVRDEKGLSLLHKVAAKEKTSLLQELLKLPNINIDIRDKEGKTPLMVASENSSLGSMDSLIDAGANIDALDKRGRTALYYAVIRFAPAPVNLLVKKGANITIVPKNDSKSMLHQAAEGRYPTILGTFLKAGIKIDRKDKDGNTAMHVAVRFNNLEVIEHLLSNGAKTDIKNNAGFTPMDIARNKNYKEAHMMLVEYEKYKKQQNVKNENQPINKYYSKRPRY